MAWGITTCPFGPIFLFSSNKVIPIDIQMYNQQLYLVLRQVLPKIRQNACRRKPIEWALSKKFCARLWSWGWELNPHQVGDIANYASFYAATFSFFGRSFFITHESSSPKGYAPPKGKTCQILFLYFPPSANVTSDNWVESLRRVVGYGAPATLSDSFSSVSLYLLR